MDMAAIKSREPGFFKGEIYEACPSFELFGPCTYCHIRRLWSVRQLEAG
jgi:hypothetical protein